MSKFYLDNHASDPEPIFSFDKLEKDIEPPTDEEFVQNSIDLLMASGMGNGKAISKLEEAIEVAPENLKPIIEKKIEELKMCNKE